jgi:Bifunctional DNA primase/polymerase, N-terminal
LKHGRPPETAEQLPGGGGRHIFFRDPGVPVPSELAQGIDVKSSGGYIIVAPSIHLSDDVVQVHQACHSVD